MQVPVTKGVVQVTAPLVATGSEVFYQVTAGGDLTLSGSNCEVYVVQNGKVLVSGSNNTLYLARQSKAEVTGANNTIYLIPDGSAKLVDRGTGNRKRVADGFDFQVVAAPVPTPAPAPPPAPETAPVEAPPIPAPAEPEVIVAVGAATVGEALQPPVATSIPPAPAVPAPPVAKSEDIVDQPAKTSSFDLISGFAKAGKGYMELLKLFPAQTAASKILAAPEAMRDPEENLCGKWQISSLTTEGFGGDLRPNLDGTMTFAKGGIGWLDAKIILGDKSVPQVGGFKWATTKDSVTISPEVGTGSKWVRVQDKPDEQETKFVMEAGPIVKLHLIRIP